MLLKGGISYKCVTLLYGDPYISFVSGFHYSLIATISYISLQLKNKSKAILASYEEYQMLLTNPVFN